MVLGIAYPLQIVKGQLVTSSDAELAYQHIKAVIQTETFERLGLINFGLPDYTFTSYPNFLQVGNDIKERLETNVTECRFNVNSDLDDNGIGVIQIYWTYLAEEQDPIALQFR
jgi:hypothetical protein